MPSILKFALPALAVANTAFGASCSVSGTTTIQNSGDATAIAGSCSTFTGSIAVATGTTDDIALDGLKQLNGNLIAKNVTGLKRIGASNLETHQGDMVFDTLTSLAGADFPLLKSVTSLKWSALPVLRELGFTNGLQKASTIDIQNTGLRDLNGISIQQADTINLANNPQITSFGLSLGNVTQSLTIAGTAGNKIKVDLSSLAWAANLTFRYCSDVSLGSLQTLNGSLGFYNNDIETISAPNLTTVGRAIAVIGNDKVNNLTFSQLTQVKADIVIANNSALLEIDGFSQLQKIGGAFDMSGNFSTVETPQINDIEGTFNLQSSDNVTAACDFYQSLQKNRTIKGSFFCKGKVVDPGQQGHNPTSQGGGGKSNSGSHLSAVNGAFALAAMVAVLLF